MKTATFGDLRLSMVDEDALLKSTTCAEILYRILLEFDDADLVVTQDAVDAIHKEYGLSMAVSPDYSALNDGEDAHIEDCRKAMARAVCRVVRRIKQHGDPHKSPVAGFCD